MSLRSFRFSSMRPARLIQSGRSKARAKEESCADFCVRSIDSELGKASTDANRFVATAAAINVTQKHREKLLLHCGFSEPIQLFRAILPNNRRTKELKSARSI